MITESFDVLSKAIMGPEDFYKEKGSPCDLCIMTFSKVIFDNVLENFDCQKAGHISNANGGNDIYSFTYKGIRIACVMAGIGSMMASTEVIEVNYLTGAEKFIMFGSAGSLDGEKTKGKYVLPTEAYRDEGMSYHYKEASDYISIKNSDLMAEIFDKLDLPYIQGRVWTTDGFYRETRGNLEKRQKDGCIAVEMELAGVQAVCDFHGLELYDFLATGDVLSEEDYDMEGLHDANHNLDKFYIALKLAEILQK